jgi:hypothetical protein
VIWTRQRGGYYTSGDLVIARVWIRGARRQQAGFRWHLDVNGRPIGMEATLQAAKEAAARWVSSRCNRASAPARGSTPARAEDR